MNELNNYADVTKDFWYACFQTIQKEEKELFLYTLLEIKVWYMEFDTLSSIFKRDFNNFLSKKEIKDFPSNYEY